MQKNLKIGILLVFATPIAVWCGAQPQGIRLLDVTPSGVPSDALRNAPLSVEDRADLQKALETRDYTRAETILVKEIDRNAKSPQLLILAGGVFFLGGKYLNSAIAFKKAEALVRLDDRSRFTLAMAYVTLNHRDWARPELEKLAASDPRNALYPYWLSRLDYDAMHFQSAIRHAQRALELNPNFMKAYDNLGLCYEAVGQHDQALEAYRTGVRLNENDRPCSPWPPLDLGALLVKLGRLGEAEEFLKESLDCDSRFPRAHYQMGLLMDKQGKPGAAIEELEQAASLDPGFAEPYYLLGQIYQREGDDQKSAEALAIFERLKKAQPHERPH